MRYLLCTTLLVLGLALHGEAAVFHDGASNAQRMLEFVKAQADQVKMYTESLRQYAQMIRQYEQDARGVLNTGRMVVQGTQQLANLPKDLSIVGLLAYYDSAVNRLTGLVHASTATMGYLYAEVGKVATVEGRARLLADMKAERLRLMQILVAAQSDQREIAAAQQRIAALVREAAQAEGQKAVLQAQLNVSAMMDAHNRQVQAWQESMAKVMMIEKLEQAAERDAALKAQAHFLRGMGEGPGWGTIKPTSLEWLMQR